MEIFVLFCFVNPYLRYNKTRGPMHRICAWVGSLVLTDDQSQSGFPPTYLLLPSFLQHSATTTSSLPCSAPPTGGQCTSQ